MDILFVVDNSGSMEDEQEELGRNFPEFARILDEYRVSTGEPLDYRVALTTTAREIWTRQIGLILPAHNGIPDNGLFRKARGMTKAWIEAADADRRTLLQSIAAVGIDGSAIEMPLDAARMALSQVGTGMPNAGFVREDALLAVVFLTDEEDCSRNDGRTRQAPIQVGLNPDVEGVVCGALDAPSVFIDFLDQVKGDRKRWATAVIAGDGMGSRRCGTAEDGADDAPRLKQFVEQTGDNAIFRSICDEDFAPALKDALDTFQAACEGLPPVD
jgi:hypothetical protein